MKLYIYFSFLFCFATAIHAMEVKPEMTIFEAARTNNSQFIKEQLEKIEKNHKWRGIDAVKKEFLRQKDPQGQTALHCAARHGNSAFVKTLLSSPISLENEEASSDTDINGHYPLHLAVQHGDYETNQAFVDRYCKNYREDVWLSLPFFLFTPIIYHWHFNGVNKQDKNGNTPLHLAIEKKDPKLVDILLQAVGNHTSFLADNTGKTVVHTAALAGNFDSFQSLLNKGFSVHDVDLEQRTTLHDAAQGGSAQIVNKLLELKVDHTKVDKKGNSAIHIAAYHGKADALTELLKHGCSIDSKNSDGLTLLFIATIQNQVPAMKVLLDKKGNPNCTDKEGLSALFYATKANHVEAMTALLEAGANPNCTDKDGLTPLLHATKNNQLKAMTALLNAKANPNGCGKESLTPLFYATIQNQVPAMKVLLDKKANPNCTDKDGLSALFYATKKNQIEAMITLLEAGANPDCTNIAGLTPLFYTTMQNLVFPEMHTLLSKKANPNCANKDGLTALFYAAKKNQIEAMITLLEAGASPNCTDEKGLTPLIWATNKNQLQIMKLLLNKGANPCLTDGTYKDDPRGGGRTALHRAVIKGHIKATETLLAHDKDRKLLNMLDKGEATLGIVAVAKGNITEGGKTALYYAIKKANQPIMNLLLNSGANIDKTGDYCKTPLQLAAVTNNSEVIEKLLRRCAIVDRGIMSDTNISWCTDQLSKICTPNNFRKGISVMLGLLLERPIPSEAIPDSLIKVAVMVCKDPLERKKLAILHAMGMTALHFAAKNGRQEIVEALLIARANVAAVGFEGKIPLHHAAKYGFIDIVSLLLKSDDSSKDAQDDYGMTPLHYAARYGHLKVAKKLLEHEANPLIKNNEGKMPLHEACEHGNRNASTEQVKLVQLLIQSMRNNGKKQPLQKAYEYHHNKATREQAELAQYIEYAIIDGATVMQRDNLARIPLHYAAANGDLDIITLLLFYSPRDSLHCEDNQNAVPYRIAMDAGHTEAASLLKDKSEYITHKEEPCKNAQ